MNKGPEQASLYMGRGDMPAEDATFGTSFSASPWHPCLCPIWEPGVCLTGSSSSLNSLKGVTRGYSDHLSLQTFCEAIGQGWKFLSQGVEGHGWSVACICVIFPLPNPYPWGKLTSVPMRTEFVLETRKGSFQCPHPLGRCFLWQGCGQALWTVSPARESCGQTPLENYGALRVPS